jgi:Mrp family chromosome partitioning ATPase/capsular polysaccharide biosynthesis protein
MNETTDASAIFAPLWKRKWLILLAGVLVGVGTYVYYQHRPKIYQAATKIYLENNSQTLSLLGGTQTNVGLSDRELSDQAQIINSSLTQEAVLRRLIAAHELEAARGSAEAISTTGSDFITISTTAHTASGAVELANAYATEYIHKRNANYRHIILAALRSTQSRLKQAQKSGFLTGASKGLQTQELISRENQLESLLSVGNVGDRQIDPAVASSVPISPRPTRNAIFGFVIAIALAAITVYILNQMDRRLRSWRDIEAAFGVPILTALPSVRRPIVHQDGEPIPAKNLREPLRRLHTTLQLRGMLEREDEAPPRSVLFVSAAEADGKSSVVANLALVQREAGERVAVIESDMRRPVQARLLGVDGERGLAEVLLGELTMNDAIQKVAFGSGSQDEVPASSGGSATAVQAQAAGSVSVLAGGGAVANPPALLADRAMLTLIQSVVQDFDYVLFDAPPPLEVSDVLPLLPEVDAIVIVVRFGYTGKASAHKLMELLTRAHNAPVIGIVANEVPSSEIDELGFSSSYHDPRRRRT